MKNRKFEYFIRKIRIPFILLSLFLSILGSYQLYHGQTSGILKEITVIFTSVMKLFSFSPTAGLLEETPLAYSIAVWIAPLSLAVGIFSVFTPIYSYLRQALIHFGKEHLVLMGDIDDSLTFIRNLASSKPKSKIIYLCDYSDYVDEDRLINMDVKIVRIDLNNPGHKANRLIVKNEKIGDLGQVINFDSDLIGFGRARSFAILMESFDKKIDFYQKSASFRLKEIMEESLDEIENLDIHYFDTNFLLINHLIENKKFEYNITNGLKENWKGKDIKSIEDICKQIGVINILILGFNDLAESFLMQVSNTATINTLYNVKVTIIDPDIMSKFETFKDRIREIDRVLDYKLLNYKIDSRQSSDKIKSLHTNEKFTSLVLCDKDLNSNIRILDRIIDDLNDIPIAIYDTNKNRMKIFVDAIKSRSKNIKFFGDRSEVLTKENIIDENVLNKAKEFNSFYDRTMNELMGWEDDKKSKEEKWLNLSNIKKESSINQTMHQRVKMKILQKFVELDNTPESVEELIKLWSSRLESVNVSEKVNIIEKDFLINYMTSLEHKRWNNFYYMRDFVYDEEKNEKKKQHDCLIDSWGEFMTSIQRDKAIYDFLSTLSLVDNHD